MRRVSKEEFIRRAREKHGDKYDYSQVEYVGTETKVTIVCPIHGPFQQTPKNHMNGKGCPECGREIAYKRKTTEQFIKEAREVHGMKYGYEKTRYTNTQGKVVITCPQHGDFEQQALQHLQGHGCPECSFDKHSEELTKTAEDFIRDAKAVHGDRYDYSRVSYRGTTDEVEIICREHGSFIQTPASHLRGHGCPKCSASKREKQIMAWLEQHGIQYEFDKSIPNPRNKVPLRVDFVIDSRNLFIEHQGEQHYNQMQLRDAVPLRVQQQRDQDKRDYCEANGIRLEEIRYDEDLEARLREIFNV